MVILLLIIAAACMLGGILYMMQLVYRLLRFFLGKRRVKTPLRVKMDEIRNVTGARRKDMPEIMRLIADYGREYASQQNGPAVAAAPTAAPALPDTEATEKPAASAEGQKAVSDWPPGWERDPAERKATRKAAHPAGSDNGTTQRAAKPATVNPDLEAALLAAVDTPPQAAGEVAGNVE